MYCRSGASIEHLYMSLPSETVRDELYEYIMTQDTTEVDDTQQQNLTILWQNGVISNFDYLSHLNRCEANDCV